MTRQDVLTLFDTLETKFPVFDWKHENMDVWPIIKTYAFFHWEKANSAGAHLTEVKKRENFMSKVCRLVQSFYAFGKLYLRRGRSIDRVYLGAAHFRSNVDGELVNRFFYPLNEASPLDSYLEVEYNDKGDVSKYKNKKHIIFTKHLIPVSKLISLLDQRRPVGFEGEKIDEVFSILEAKLDVALKTGVIGRLRVIKVYVRIFRWIYRKYKPQAVFGLCYYNVPMFAAHYVANENGIENYDMQHGGQGRSHPLYTFSIDKFPLRLNVLPQFFWCWDQVSFDHIHSWLKQGGYHKVVKQGNPWIDYVLKKEAAYLSASNEKMILYTMQYAKLDNFVLEAIEKTPPPYKWWIRMHPRQLQHAAKIKATLASIGVLDRVEIECATTWPLPVLLNQCFLHISKFSGSIIEAAILNKHTVIIDEIGVQSYSQYIEAGLATAYSESRDGALIDTIMYFTRQLKK